MSPTSTNEIGRYQGASRQVGTILATIICLVLSAVFVVVGGWLIVRGFGAVFGALFVGRGEAIVLLLALGFTGLLVAGAFGGVALWLIQRMRSRELIRKWETQQDSWKASR
jgi:hypothetical protein